MLTQKEIVDFCLTFPSAYIDYPFGEDWLVMRLKENKKCFAYIYTRLEKLCINLKSDPMSSELLRAEYEAIIPGYHMNKRYWNTVILDGTVEEHVIFQMIKNSYKLVEPKRKEKKYDNTDDKTV